MSSKVTTLRRCLGCRESSPKRSLLRFVWHERQLRWDTGHNLVGRGAYLHPNGRCLKGAADVGRWVRSMRITPGQLNQEGVSKLLTEVQSQLG